MVRVAEEKLQGRTKGLSKGLDGKGKSCPR